MRIFAGRDHSQGVQPCQPRPSAPKTSSTASTANGPPDLVAAYVEHARFVERVLRRAGVAERDVPDARQDVFVVAHRRLASFEGRGRLSTWLYRIAWNVASEYRRRACHRRERLGELASDDEGARETEGAQALRLEHRELLSHALHALDALDDDKREAFVLAELVGLSMREVAVRAGCPLKTAFSRAYAARRRVLAALRERGVVMGLAPWIVPLRLQRLRAHAPCAKAGSAVVAQAQLALLSLACVTLPSLAGSSAPLAASVLRSPRASAVAVPVPRAESAHVVAPSEAPRAHASATTERRRHLPRSRAAARPHQASDVPAVAVAIAPAPIAAVDLIVVHDGHAWLVPAVDHPLDRAPALRPALPPIALLRDPRSALGGLPDELPPILD